MFASENAKQRNIWILTITNTKTGRASDKPAFFLDGGTHAGELGGSETALYTAWYLVTRYGKDPQVTELLDTRAVVDFVTSHPNIAGMQSLHHCAGAILRPFCNLTDDNFPPQDLVYYDYIANRGHEITNYDYIGVWKPFKHPQYGDVEIGGWIQFSVSNPPADIMEAQMLIPNMRFILYHASTMPSVRVSDVKVTAKDGVDRINATIENQGLLPTNVTEQAIRAGIARPVAAKIELRPGVSLISGTPAATLGHLGGTPPVVKEYTFGSQAFGGANRKTVEWIVSGKGEITVTAVSQKGGAHVRRAAISG